MLGQNLWKTVSLPAALMLSAATQAQPLIQLKDAPPPAPDDLVIIARPDPTERDVQRQAKAISRMTDFYAEPLARFGDSICPGVMGLPAEVAGMLVHRIRENAQRVGAALAPEAKCKANVVLAFVRDGDTEVRKLMESHGYHFANMDDAEVRELQSEAGPARAWNLTVLLNRFGEAQSPHIAQDGAVYIDGPSPGLGPMRFIRAPSSDSRVFLNNRIDITYSVVVIDVTAIDGLSIDQIADYATMRALARTRPAQGDSAASTILSLFDPSGRPPPQMTRFDLAYLRSLYSALGNLPASAKIGGVARELRKEEARALKVSAPQK